MSHVQSDDGSIVIHRSQAYDLAFGWLSRRSDRPMLQRAGVGRGERVLDVGTGPGYLALAASRLVGPEGAATGIDASTEMIERARTLALREGSAAQFTVASATALPFDDASFDVVVSRLVFHHLTGGLKAEALAEILRVLRPGGRVLIVDGTSRFARSGHHLLAHLQGSHPESAVSLERLVWDAGFRQIEHGPLMCGFLAGVLAVKPDE